MLTFLKQRWRSLKSGKPGTRFKEQYHSSQKNKSNTRRYFYLGLGILLMVAGVVLSVPPGVPGFLVVILGAAVVSVYSPKAAQLFDRMETFGRRIIARLFRKQ